MRKPGLLTGALVGGLLTAPLIALSAVATAAAALPFPPFVLFPPVRDLIPGPLLTFGIDRMTDAILALDLGRVDVAAKIAEQAMAVGLLLVFGIVVGALFFVTMRFAGRFAALPGLILGLVIGVALALSNLRYDPTASTMPLDSIWLIALFVAWGLLLGWSYGQLMGTRVSTTAQPRTPTYRVQE